MNMDVCICPFVDVIGRYDEKTKDIVYHCKKCGKGKILEKRNISTKIVKSNKYIRPLTPWEREKLDFQKSDSKWKDHIAHRKNVKGPDGKTHTVLTDDHGNIKREVPIPQ